MSNWYERVFNPPRKDSPEMPRLKARLTKVQAEVDAFNRLSRKHLAEARRRAHMSLRRILRQATHQGTLNATQFNQLLTEYVGRSHTGKLQSYSQTQPGKRSASKRKSLKAELRTVKAEAQGVLRSSTLNQKTKGTLSSSDLLKILEVEKSAVVEAYRPSCETQHELEQQLAELVREDNRKRRQWLNEQHRVIGLACEKALKAGALDAGPLDALLLHYASEGERQLVKDTLFRRDNKMES